MFLSIATTHRPATDLGYLLHKHPDRVHETELGFGKAFVFYPTASEERCEAVLVLDVDPVGLVRGRGTADGLLDQYGNDRPYAVSSFLSVALAGALRTAMGGTSKGRPELAEAAPKPSSPHCRRAAENRWCGDCSSRWDGRWWSSPSSARAESARAISHSA